MVGGVKEWFGKEAQLFKKTRNTVETVVESYGFDFFHSGLLSSDNLYKDQIDVLGEQFLRNLGYINLRGGEQGIILSPEGTFKTYDYILRKNIWKGKVYYSQEFVRNEDHEEIRKGKTRSFWQVGYEIFGYPQFEASIEIVDLALSSIKAAGISEAFARIADKRILEGLILDLPLDEKRKIYDLIDSAQDDGDQFYQLYTESKGNKFIAENIRELLTSGMHLTLDDLHRKTNNAYSSQGINFIQKAFDRLNGMHPEDIRLFPFIGKSWDACHMFMFDIRIPSYPYAVAGGGNLNAFKTFKAMKSGAGIGVTRIAEYLISKENEGM